MNSATPWWGTLVVAAVGFFGVLLAQLWTSSRDQRRADQERHERAVAARAEVYADFYRTASSMHLEWTKLSDVEAQKRQEVLDRLWRERALLSMLAPLGVALAAQRTLDEFTEYMRVGSDGSHADVREASAELIEVTDNMLKLMRLDTRTGLRPRWWQVARCTKWRAAQKQLNSRN